MPTKKRVAIVHYWLLRMRGGEKVVEALCELFPDADLFTLFYDPRHVSATINRHRVITSGLHHLPFSKRYYQALLPFFPLAIEHFDLRGYDLVISSESGIAKGVLTDPNVPHICYCHSPMRYIWNMYHDYREGLGCVGRGIFRVVSHYLRLWDLASAARVDHFIANSHNVRGRIAKYYRRGAEVVHPPVDVDRFSASSRDEGYYLSVGQLVPYKRVDIAIEAMNRMKRRLIVVGDGSEMRRLKKLAGPTIEFVGWTSDAALAQYYHNCSAFLFPGEEDFGIAPVEAQASGKAVIAYRAGGAMETVIDGKTGIFFDRQDPADLCAALERFEATRVAFNPQTIRTHAESFRKEIFKERITKALASFGVSLHS